ncbi:hypothetical protein BDB01DRAFT_842337 [Pilobolus umbonatus]|nr:hypothetical protein BDB01DRAFT_842337 [Pilobolus umbonatus]
MTTTDPNEISQLQNTLIESFQQISSIEQMGLCQRLGILSKAEQQQVYKMAKALIEDKQLPITMSDWHGLRDWIMMLRDRYQHQMELQCVHTFSNDMDRISHFEEVQRLSQLLEEYAQAHEDLSELLLALKKLRNEWKNRKRDVENIVLSILSSSSRNNNEYRLIKITKSNVISLGLGLGSIGKYYVLFEPFIVDEKRKEILNHVARDFSMVFQENATQNLARMADSYHRIFHQDDHANITEDIQKLSMKVYISRPRSILLPYPSGLPTPSTSQDGTFIERRKSIIIASEDEPMLFNMSKPYFEPAGWDWPHIIKQKKRGRTQSGSYYWCHSSQQDTLYQQNIWSTSLSRLADHFAKIGQEYYANMLNNARLMHSHRTHMFEFATHSLLKTYHALQLEQGCANLNRTLISLHQLQQDL